MSKKLTIELTLPDDMVDGMWDNQMDTAKKLGQRLAPTDLIKLDWENVYKKDSILNIILAAVTEYSFKAGTSVN